MFATLGTLECPAKPRRPLRRRSAPPALTCSRVTLPNFFSFYHIQVPRQNDAALPWNEIAETAGAFRRRLLLPAGLTPDQGSPAAAFVPQRLPLIVLCNSALQALQTMGLDPALQKLCVADPRGVLAEQVEAFALLVAEIRVVTDDLAAYGETAERLRRRYGLSLLVTPDETQGMADSNLLILDDAADAPLAFRGILFTNHPKSFMNAAVYSPGALTLPPAFAALCPPGIDPLQFASAAYELCAADELGGLWAACRQN